jgi:hypothetical protein
MKQKKDKAKQIVEELLDGNGTARQAINEQWQSKERPERAQIIIKDAGPKKDKPKGGK